LGGDPIAVTSTRRLLIDSAIGIAACLSLVVATNAVFVSSWLTILMSMAAAVGLSLTLVVRVLRSSSSPGLMSVVAPPVGLPDTSPALTQA
jgi:hypothetical protein